MTERLLLRLVMVTRRLMDVAGVEMLDADERQVLRDVSAHLRTTYGPRNERTGDGSYARSLADERGSGL